MSAFTRTGTSIVPPTAEELSRARREDGIRRSAAHADAVDPTWRAKAMGYVRLHAVVHATFLTEDVRGMAEADGLPKPPDGRAWGSVMQGAVRARIIRRVGYAPAHSSNGSPKCVWTAA